MKNIITYGTFDLLHYGHVELLRRAKELSDGGKLIVGISSDDFNLNKGKQSHLAFEKRKQLVEAIRYVDKTIPEENWNQKREDIKKYEIDVFVMGADWEGKFDELSDLCKVIYLPRTPQVSSTVIKKSIRDSESIPRRQNE